MVAAYDRVGKKMLIIHNCQGMKPDFRIVYLISVSAAALLAAVLIPLFIHRFENSKRRRIENLARFSAVATNSPVKGGRKKAIEHAVESVGGRFSIIKRIAVVSVITIWVILAAFPFLGSVPATAVSILVSVVGVLLGIAARPLIENLIAGIIISFSKLFRIGDTVFLDDAYGTVEDITMTHSVIKIWDWRRYVIPNSRMLTKDVINYTLFDSFVWAHVEFFVSYEADLRRVEQLAVEIAEARMVEKNYEEPRFWVMDMEKDSIRCWVAAWAKTPAEAWTLRAGIRTELAMRLREEGIATHMGQVRFTSPEGKEKQQGAPYEEDR